VYSLQAQPYTYAHMGSHTYISKMFQNFLDCAVLIDHQELAGDMLYQLDRQ
jgi:hypothetical protein